MKEKKDQSKKEDKFQLIYKTLKEKMSNDFCCPYCKGTAFAISAGKFVRMLVTENLDDFYIKMETNYIKGKDLPVVTLFCEKCGHLSFFSARKVIEDLEKK